MLILEKSTNLKHEEKESTSAGTLQRVFQVSDSDALLRGNGESQMEHGFGVAGMNCFHWEQICAAGADRWDG